MKTSITGLNKRFTACAGCPAEELAPRSDTTMNFDFRLMVDQLEIVARGDATPSDEYLEERREFYMLPEKLGDLAWQCAQAKANGTCNK